MRVKGFTLLETLLTLTIISTISLLGSTILHPFNFNGANRLYSDCMYTQVLALTSETQIEVNPVDSICVMDHIFYYQSGNVNKAQTIECGNKQLIMHLGNGNIE